MAMFILLTAGQADQVRGPSENTPSAALEPAERQGGVYILGVEVLTDPAHAAHRAFLTPLPRLSSTDPGFPPPLAP